MLWPVCSFQGRVLGQRTEPPSERGLSLFSPESGDWEHIGPYPWAYPTWARDERSVVGLDLVSMQIWRLWVETRRDEMIVDVGDMQLGGLTIAPWMGLAADDSPLVMRSHDTREIYALEFEVP